MCLRCAMACALDCAWIARWHCASSPCLGAQVCVFYNKDAASHPTRHFKCSYNRDAASHPALASSVILGRKANETPDCRRQTNTGSEVSRAWARMQMRPSAALCGTCTAGAALATESQVRAWPLVASTGEHADAHRAIAGDSPRRSLVASTGQHPNVHRGICVDIACRSAERAHQV